MRTKQPAPFEFQALLQAIPEPFLILDRKSDVVHINHLAAQLLGVSEGPLMREVFRAAFEVRGLDGKTLSPEQWPFARALRGDFCRNQEVVLKRRDNGGSFFAEVTTSPLRNVSDPTGQILCMFRDITDWKQVEAARALVATIVDSSEDAIIGSTIRGEVTSWNQGAEKIFGYLAAEMIGRSLLQLIPWAQDPEEDVILGRIMQGETVEQLETVRVRKNGEVITVAVTVSPIRDAWGDIIGASNVARTITGAKKLERQVLQGHKMDAVGQLTGGIAHDFNNLLSVLMGNLELLERLVQDNVPALARLHSARKAANRGPDLTRRLLALASED